MNAEPVRWVRMGEWALGRPPQVLKATLGSCVGIALVWPAQGACALAHCLLPAAPAGLPTRGARYVDQALRTLLAALAVPPDRHGELQVHLCGGARMQEATRSGTPLPEVGQRNLLAAQQGLAGLNLVLRASDTGGRCARQIVVDCSSGLVQMLRVPAPEGAAGPDQ